MFSRALASPRSVDETSDIASYESVLEDLGAQPEGNGSQEDSIEESDKNSEVEQVADSNNLRIHSEYFSYLR